MPSDYKNCLMRTISKSHACILPTLLVFLGLSIPASPQNIRQSTQLSVVSTSAPKYGPIAIAAKVKGKVVVKVSVDQKGNVTSAEAIEGHPLLRRSAEEAARLWKFNPTSDEASRLANLEFTFDVQLNKPVAW